MTTNMFYYPRHTKTCANKRRHVPTNTSMENIVQNTKYSQSYHMQRQMELYIHSQNYDALSFLSTVKFPRHMRYRCNMFPDWPVHVHSVSVNRIEVAPHVAVPVYSIKCNHHIKDMGFVALPLEEINQNDKQISDREQLSSSSENYQVFNNNGMKSLSGESDKLANKNTPTSDDSKKSFKSSDESSSYSLTTSNSSSSVSSDSSLSIALDSSSSPGSFTSNNGRCEFCPSPNSTSTPLPSDVLPPIYEEVSGLSSNVMPHILAPVHAVGPLVFAEFNFREEIDEMNEMMAQLESPVGDLKRIDIKDLVTYEVTEERYLMNKTCSVCLYNYQSQEVITMLPCYHEFHSGCIDFWLQNNSNCPMCREEI